MAAPAVNELVTIDRVVGNTEPIGWTLQDIDGVALDMTGKTLLFRMVLISTGAVKVDNASASNDTPLSGQGSYTPVAEDVDTAGLYAMYVIDDDTNDRLFPYDGARYQLNLKAETAA